MSLFVARNYQLVAGTGKASTTLNAFDRALQNAGVSHFNLVKVSSILPPNAKPGSVAVLPAGGVLFSAIAAIESDIHGELISAAVSVGIPKDPKQHGVIMELHLHGSSKEIEEQVREMARVALADRNIELLRVESIAVETIVTECNSAFAAVVLW